MKKFDPETFINLRLLGVDPATSIAASLEDKPPEKKPPKPIPYISPLLVVLIAIIFILLCLGRF